MSNKVDNALKRFLVSGEPLLKAISDLTHEELGQFHKAVLKIQEGIKPIGLRKTVAAYGQWSLEKHISRDMSDDEKEKWGKDSFKNARRIAQKWEGKKIPKDHGDHDIMTRHIKMMHGAGMGNKAERFHDHVHEDFNSPMKREILNISQDWTGKGSIPQDHPDHKVMIDHINSIRSEDNFRAKQLYDNHIKPTMTKSDVEDIKAKYKPASEPSLKEKEAKIKADFRAESKAKKEAPMSNSTQFAANSLKKD